jgi:putative transcriptional regulator
VKGPAERMLRVLYLAYADGNGDIRRMIDRLAELDAKLSPDRIILRETREGWIQDEGCATSHEMVCA